MYAIEEAFQEFEAVPAALSATTAQKRGRKTIRRRIREAFKPKNANKASIKRLLPILPPKFRLLGLSWLAVYPLVTLLIAATAPMLDGQPIYLRTLAASLVMVPLMIWIVQPRVARLAGAVPKPIPKAPENYCL